MDDSSKGTRRQVPFPQKGVKLQENRIRSLQKKWKKSASKSVRFSEPEEFQSSEPAATSAPSIGSLSYDQCLEEERGHPLWWVRTARSS